ncbi:MAG: mercuric reductase [Fidelibacterota bacterium]
MSKQQTSEHYDAIVIGTGQGGNPLSLALGKAGWKTAVIEREHVGGTCVNVGCTPTKTMVASARVAHLARRAADYGVRTSPVEVDIVKVRQRKRDIVHDFSSGSKWRLENTDGVHLVMGEASFTGPRSIEVREDDGTVRQLEGDSIFINVGCGPGKPDIAGLDSVPHLDSTSIMELSEVPDHLLVVGGGYIGLEFGQMFRRFGARVTIVQRGKQLLSKEDPDVAEEVVHILRGEGVGVWLSSQPRAVGIQGNGSIFLTIQTAEKEVTLEGSHLLVAAGRVPRSDALNLEAAGVKTDGRGYIQVNNRLETNVEGIYALGDVKGGPMFTHISYDDFRLLRTNLLEGGDVTTDGRLVPYTVFMDPELGRVGLTEQEARAQGYRVRVAKLPMTGVARALETDETLGFMKAVVDADTNQILGCAMLGVEGGELMCMVEIAMMGKLPYTVLKDAIFAHPTRGEALNNLFMAMDAT